MITPKLIDMYEVKLAAMGFSLVHRETIRMMLKGYTHKQTAGYLHVSEKTIKARCTKMYKTVGAYNKVDFFVKLADHLIYR